MRRLIAIALALCAASLAAAAAAGTLLDAGGAAASDPASTGAASLPARGAPNFLFVLVDDQATDSFRAAYMPRTFNTLVRPGTKFTNALAAPPLCCPDRAGLLTGQYPHNEGVWSNHPGYEALRDKDDTLPVWLRRAGYRTGYFGKFLNHYSDYHGLAPAPGFDRWFAYTWEGSTYYHYYVSDDGVLRAYGTDRSEYSTDVLTRQAGTFMRDSISASRPFFAWLAYSTPHPNRVTEGPCAGRNPVPPDRAAWLRFADATLPRPRSFNEADVSDKPRRIARLPLLDAPTIALMTQQWRCTLAAMSEVDREVGQLMAQLRNDGQLSHTIVIYMSDNGLMRGQHRVEHGKGVAYEPALRVPLAVYVPPAFRSGPSPQERAAVVSNQDIAPTILDYVKRYAGPAASCASSTDCRRMDGRSLVPLLGGGGDWQGGRGVLAEIDSRPATSRPKVKLRRGFPSECNCAYEAIRTDRYLYEELSTGERELYDLRLDPGELTNEAGSPRYGFVQRELAARLASLERCSGHRGRDPAGTRPFCE